MAHVKTERTWRPSLLQTRVGEGARLTAKREAARIPWPQLHGARKRYVLWEAFALWVRAIEDAEGDFPQWLADVVDKRCRGFSKFVAEKKLEHTSYPPLCWYHLERWINEHIFGKVWREGWMNAVGYYAARDLASLRNHGVLRASVEALKTGRLSLFPRLAEILRALRRPGARRMRNARREASIGQAQPTSRPPHATQGGRTVS